jgi:outer membrane protein TolC
VTSTLNLEHARLPVSSVQTAGSNNVSIFNQNTGTANFTYNQGFATGTNFAFTFNNGRLATNSQVSYLNPAITGTMQLKFTQHLLQGFGIETNTRFIRIAKNNREISDIAFRQQVITTVAQIENIYWNLVNAYEDVKAKQRALDLANRLLADNQKQVQTGTLAPIEVIRAQSSVASASQDLIVSQTNLELQELFVKNAISRNLTDPALVAASVIPTDTMVLPENEAVTPLDELIKQALTNRPELAEAKIDLTNREINSRAARNGLRPTVDLVAAYGTAALSGMQNPYNSTLPVDTFPPTGLSDSLSTLFGTKYPDYAVGFSVNIPIRNRAAQATQIRAELEYRQAQMRMQQVENQIRVQVVNAQFTLQQNRARVDAAVKGRLLALESLSAEQKKYALGASTAYNVMSTQRDLSTAESNLILAMAAYEQSRVAMDTATGLLLTSLGIEMEDAVTGNVGNLPRVPNVVPSASLTVTPAPDKK